MSLTGNQLLTQLSRFLGDLDFPEGVTTTAAGSTSTLVDTKLGRFGDDYLNDWFLRITVNVAGNQYLVRRVNDFVSSSGTCTTAVWAGTTGSGTAYEIHRLNPAEKFTALDEARFNAYPALGTLVYNETLTGDGVQRTFDIPSNIRRGPITVFLEKPVMTETNWNFVTSPNGDSLTGWTAASLTAALKTHSDADNVVPKYGETAATSFTVAATTAATYKQVVADMANGVTAATAAGRKMTYAKWVYCTAASAYRIGITDDTDTTYSSYHAGSGWEMLTVEKTIDGANATTLTLVDDIPSVAAAHVHFWQRAWFYFGSAEKVTESWEPVAMTNVRRDDTTQKFTLGFTPARGLQLRLVGRGLLSALGNTASSQATNTMEIDEAEAEILCAEAAKILFMRGILSSAVMQELAGPLGVADARLKELKGKWKQKSPGPRVTSMWLS